MSKRRKWPLKGWHKRYFIMELGVLTYGKTKTDITRGRTLGIYLEQVIVQQLKGTFIVTLCALHLIRVMSDSQQYPLNLCLIKYVDCGRYRGFSVLKGVSF